MERNPPYNSKIAQTFGDLTFTAVIWNLTLADVKGFLYLKCN